MRCRQNNGFTLVELLVTMSILVVALAVGVPSFEGVANGSRLSTATGELSAAIQLARGEAVRRNRNVVLCRTENMTSCAAGTVWNGWLIFVDTDADDQVDTGEELVRVATLSEGIGVRASPAIASRNDRVTFLPNGVARAADERALLTATLGLCVSATRPADNQREVSIAYGSRTNVRSKNGAGACTQPADS
jgi:type IV fimbrial biogenesis protein FimT